jgi:hypothetical protein
MTRLLIIHLTCLGVFLALVLAAPHREDLH